MDDVTRLRRGLGWYEGELSPPALLDRGFAALRVRRDALESLPDNEVLHDQHRLEVLRLQQQVGQLDLDDEDREAATWQLEEELAWSDVMPVQRRRSFGQD